MTAAARAIEVRRLRPVIASLALAWAVTVAGQASAQAPVPCRPGHGTTTIAHSRNARLFEDERTDGYYACLYSDGHARYLSDNEHYEYGLVRFAGPYVAFVQSVESVATDVGVVNLRTGHAHYYQELAPAVEDSVCAEVDSLVLKSDGAVAWIATNFLGEICGPVHPGATIEVRVHDRYGLHVLDSGIGIVPASLRLSGSLLAWVDAGQARTATLH
jgi:hypothetical protein